MKGEMFMPISTWQKRKCVLCGARGMGLINDEMAVWMLMSSLCDDCHTKAMDVLFDDNPTVWKLLPLLCDDCRKKAAEKSDYWPKRPLFWAKSLRL